MAHESGEYRILLKIKLLDFCLQNYDNRKKSSGSKKYAYFIFFK